MIDQTTGMKSGERYRVENVERAHQFPGFFQDGKYYLGPELLTAVGWLEGKRFIYDSLDAEGEPVFANREAGTIEGLTLTLVDGTTLELSRIEASETVGPLDHSASGKEREASDNGASVKGPLRGKVVVITGASSGIGRAAAHAFACKGARLVLAARDEEALFDVLDECTDCGTDAIAITTDVTHSGQVQALAAQAAEFGHGRIDVWVNNAGVGAVGIFEDTPLESHEQVIQTDLIGYLRGAYVALPFFKAQRSGILINTLSLGSWVAQPYAAAYSASKFGLRGLTEALRGELTEFPDIHVCDIYPAVMDTPGFRDRRQLHRTCADTARPHVRSRKGGQGYGGLRNLASGSHHGWRCGAPRAFGQLPDTRVASIVRKADALGDKSQPDSRSIIRQPL